MPNLEDLFKQKIITSGPNQGKTAEQAYAIQDSKARDISSSNPFINAVSNLNGGPVKLFDVVGEINKRRKKSVLLSETPAEVEQMGLKQFAISGRPFIYGGDIFRITNQRTRTFTLMNTAVGKGSNGGVDDKIGRAIGNYASDAVTNLLSGKKELPPKPDLVALGTELAIDVADRTLGALLPNPMVPTKVVQEFESGRANKSEYFVNEWDIDKRVIKLNSKKKVPKFVDSLLKNNKNILSQTKDFLISSAASVVGGLIATGASDLLRKSLTFITGKKMSNILLGPGKTTQTNNSNGIWSNFIRNSSAYPYSNKLSNLNLAVRERGDLSTYHTLRNESWLDAAVSANIFPAGYAASIKASMTLEPTTYSTAVAQQKTDRFNKRGMTSKTDFLNAVGDTTYLGTEALNANDNNKSYDAYDFIPLKFYSIFQGKTVQFRCTVSELSETFAPSWETQKMIGNPFNFYTYQGVERSLTFSFKVFSLNLAEHINAWERLQFLAGLTYPQGYTGISGAVQPPLIKFTLGNMYKLKEGFIDNLQFTVDTNTPWEIGMNDKIAGGGGISPVAAGGFVAPLATNISAENYKLPMIINVDITIKFIESRQNSTPLGKLYGYA